MSLLILEDLKKHFADQEVLRGASLRIDPGQKIGLVGRNGGGKTTLLRIIEGHESPDWGKVTRRKAARIGSVPQRPAFAPGQKVREYVESGLDEVQHAIADLERCAEAMCAAEGDELERLMRKHDELSARVEALGGWETERRVETVLSGIGLGPEFWDREARTLSGGEKSRTALARELVSGHDLLLLDEPTNHLDLEGIEWLERYLAELAGAVLIVSHDRRLLQNAVEVILELERGALTRYAGNYSKYLQQKEERFEADMRAWKQQQEEIKREEVFIKKHMGSQRVAEAKGRLKRLSRVERLQKPNHDVRRPVIRPPKAARGGELVLHAHDLSGGYEDNVLFTDAEVRIGRGQRIGVVGPNGAGKSTLVKILTGRMQPLAGQVETGHGALCSYYDQDTSALRDDFDVIGELRRDWPLMTDLEARNHLARFLFRGDEIEKSVGTLSGGERARLCLAKIVLTSPSWFAFDEPTNHLDLASRTALEEMLSEFEGALICISHDREFLDGLCDHIIEVGPDGVRTLRGNYSHWRRAKDAELATASEERAARSAAEKKKQRAEAEQQKQSERANKSTGTGDNKQRRSGGRRVRNPYQFEKLEKRIMQLEKLIEEAQAACATEDVYRDPHKLRDTQFQIAEYEDELTQAYEKWENWS